MSVAGNETGRTGGGRRQEVGVVTSDRMEKSVVVTVARIGTHPLYKKVVRTRVKFMAHDEGNECRVGDRVRLEECRPMSARKRWRVAEILDRAAGGSTTAEARAVGPRSAMTGGVRDSIGASNQSKIKGSRGNGAIGVGSANLANGGSVAARLRATAGCASCSGRVTSRGPHRSCARCSGLCGVVARTVARSSSRASLRRMEREAR